MTSGAGSTGATRLSTVMLPQERSDHMVVSSLSMGLGNCNDYIWSIRKSFAPPSVRRRLSAWVLL